MKFSLTTKWLDLEECLMASASPEAAVTKVPRGAPMERLEGSNYGEASWLHFMPEINTVSKCTFWFMSLEIMYEEKCGWK